MSNVWRGVAVAGTTAGLVIAAAGCTGSGAHRAVAGSRHPHRTAAAVTAREPVPVRPASPLALPEPTAPPAPPGYHGPHFATPQAAMRFLAAAYNSDDAAALHAVTTPQSYARLMGMRTEAVDLHLVSCSPNPGRGDFSCTFSHDYPASLHKSGHGAATFIAAPALNPGWYMFVLAECG